MKGLLHLHRLFLVLHVSREFSLLLLVHLDDINFTYRFSYREGT